MTHTLTPSSQPLTTRIGLTLGSVLLLSFAQLAAASGPDKRGWGHHDGEKRDREIVIEDARKHTMARFERADANGDSLLTLDEMMAQASNVEERRDSHQERRGADQKGRPGMGRWRRHGGAMGPFIDPAQRETLHAQTQALMFAALDADDDGQVSAEEFAVDHRAIKHMARVEAMFVLNDTNADGSLTQDEALAATAWLVTLDADGDGKIRRRELRKLRDMQRARDAS